MAIEMAVSSTVRNRRLDQISAISSDDFASHHDFAALGAADPDRIGLHDRRLLQQLLEPRGRRPEPWGSTRRGSGQRGGYARVGAGCRGKGHLDVADMRETFAQAPQRMALDCRVGILGVRQPVERIADEMVAERQPRGDFGRDAGLRVVKGDADRHGDAKRQNA